MINQKASETELCPKCGEAPAQLFGCPELGISSTAWPCEECEEKEWEECKEREREEKRERIAKRRNDLIESRIPPLYRDSDVARFPVEWNEIKDWSPEDEKGLILVGSSGTCKTRMAAEILRRLCLKDGVNIGFVRASELAKLVRDQFYSEAKVSEKARGALRFLQTIQVLCLDDLGKQANSPTVEEAIFELIEERTSHFLPMIVTVNAVGDELATMMSADRGAPIVRRLREFCKPVVIETK